MSTVRVASFAELLPSTVTRVVALASDGVSHEIALIRIEDALYAIGDVCSHAEVSLSEGTLWEDECELECPKHGSAFSLVTGQPQSSNVLVAAVPIRSTADTPLWHGAYDTRRHRPPNEYGHSKSNCDESEGAR